DYYEYIESTTFSFKEKAAFLNKKIVQLREKIISENINLMHQNEDKLNKVLMITYVSYIVMLEYRNKVWAYDYMTFSRRIGELWEPFCKLPFDYPVYELSLYSPPNIEDVKNTLKSEISELVNDLNISENEREKLFQYYQAIWSLIDNGGNISLTLDLHFEQYKEYFDVDYKSGFSSNEKGNTNRLLLVASIYRSLPEIHNNLIFVRQEEQQNNHYLQTLKNSGLWSVYCADEAYNKIYDFTGFNIKQWMLENMDWENDIELGFKEYLLVNDLLKYLTW
ncbi:hypothetical protein LJB88_03975, partial [Erysipelotrichaceae bacterium OttesenSCG-928-M19]|nr:hypothetical protein [Erysipelotrichaceae bacterium OttesenSCG-928-M19]